MMKDNKLYLAKDEKDSDSQDSTVALFDAEPYTDDGGMYCSDGVYIDIIDNPKTNILIANLIDIKAGEIYELTVRKIK